MVIMHTLSDHGDMLGNHQLTSKNAACYKEVLITTSDHQGQGPAGGGLPGFPH